MTRGPRRATVKDVAALARVSPKTVSNVMNETVLVRPDTREKVLGSGGGAGVRTQPECSETAERKDRRDRAGAAGSGDGVLRGCGARGAPVGMAVQIVNLSRLRDGINVHHDHVQLTC